MPHGQICLPGGRTILKSLRDPPTPVGFKTLFFMEVILRMLEMQGMQPHNVQEQTQSSHPKFQDFQTRKIDQTQKIPEMPGMPGMLGMQPAGHKKSEKPGLFLIFPKINHQKADTSNPPQIP